MPAAPLPLTAVVTVRSFTAEELSLMLKLRVELPSARELAIVAPSGEFSLLKATLSLKVRVPEPVTAEPLVVEEPPKVSPATVAL